MCSKEEEQFLLLFQFMNNTGANAVRDYIDKNITKSHGSFENFLALKKHFFHHQVDGQHFCCECPVTGCSIKKKGNMMRKIFQMMYLENRHSYDSSHNVYRNGVKETICICGYKARSVDVSDFDISKFHWLILDLSISANDKKMIENIIDVRNLVSHAIDKKVFKATDLQILWNKVEQSLIVISCSPRFIKNIIDDAKKKILCGEEVEQLTTAVQKFMEDGRILFLNNNSVIDGISNLQDSACSITAQNEESGIKLDRVAKDLHEIKELLEIHMNKKTVTVGIQCDNEVAARENGNSSISTPESTNPDAQMTLKGLEHSEEMTLIENSNNQEKEAGYENQPPVDILKGRVGSVVLDLKIRSDVFDSPVKLRTELILAIKKVLQMGNIDTNVEGTITINVLFLNSLTEAQKEIIQRMLVQSTVEDSAVSVITTTSTDILSQEGEQLPTVNISTCSSCVEKDKMVGLSENQLLLEKRKYEMLKEGSSKMEKSKQPPTKKQDEKKGKKGRSCCKMFSLVLLSVIVAVVAVLYGNDEYREKTFEFVEELLTVNISTCSSRVEELLKNQLLQEKMKDEMLYEEIMDLSLKYRYEIERTKDGIMDLSLKYRYEIERTKDEFESSLMKRTPVFGRSLKKVTSVFGRSLKKVTSVFGRSLKKVTSEFESLLMRRMSELERSAEELERSAEDLFEITDEFMLSLKERTDDLRKI